MRAPWVADAAWVLTWWSGHPTSQWPRLVMLSGQGGRGWSACAFGGHTGIQSVTESDKKNKNLLFPVEMKRLVGSSSGRDVGTLRGGAGAWTLVRETRPWHVPSEGATSLTAQAGMSWVTL